MAFSTFTVSCNHHHYLVPEHFHHPKRKPVFMKQSPPVSPSPQPLATTNCLLSPRMCLFWTFHINGIIQYVTFCVWLLSLSMFSRFICVVTCVSASLLFMAEYYFTVWIHPISFFHSSVDGLLSCFHLLATVKNAAMNICVQVFV